MRIAIGSEPPIRVLARLLRRNQSMRGGNDPAVAPAHDRVNSPDSGNGVAARGHLEFRRGPRAPRFRPEPRQRSSREWLSASFPARAPKTASSPSPPRLDSHWPARRRPRSTDPRAPPAAEGLGMLPTVAGAAFRKSDVDAVFRTPSDLAAWSCLGNRQARALLSARSGQRRSGLRPQANSARRPIPVQSLLPAPSWRAGGARTIAIWLTQHQHVIAIAAQEIRQARRLPRQRPNVIRDNRLAVLHGVTHGLVSR